MLLKILLVLAFTPACFTDKFLQVNTEIIFEGVIMFYILKPKNQLKQTTKRAKKKENAATTSLTTELQETEDHLHQQQQNLKK